MLNTEQRRAGLTLIEILVALVVTSIVVLTARGIAEQLAQSSRAMTTKIDIRLAEIDRMQELRRAYRLIATPLDSSSLFDGGADQMSFSTRCTVPRGWDEACRCQIRVDRVSQPVALTRICSALLRTDTLMLDTTGLSLRYLIDAGRGGQWLLEWGRSNSLPVAIGLIRAARADTLILRIGKRG